MLRRLFTAASVTSLIISLAAAAVLARTFFTTDAISVSAGSSGIWFGTGQYLGWRQLRCAVWNPSPFSGLHLFHGHPKHIHKGWHEDDPGFNALGFHYCGDPTLVNGSVRSYGVPLWFVVALFACPPAIRFHNLMQWGRQRERRGLCRRCGYDLRASTDRCPECGAPMPVKMDA